MICKAFVSAIFPLRNASGAIPIRRATNNTSGIRESNSDAKVKINGCDRNRDVKDVMTMASGLYFARSCPQ